MALRESLGSPPVDTALAFAEFPGRSVAPDALRDTSVTLEPTDEILFRRADVNQNAKIDIADAIGILYYLFRDVDAPPCLDAADFDDDGKIDGSDAVAILDYLFRENRPPSDPFPGCGDDPTADKLDCLSYNACP